MRSYTACPEKVRKVIAMMLLNQSETLRWYAFILSQFDIVGCKELDTMAISIDPVKVVPRILVNPDFADKLNHGQIVAVLMHEIWHFLQSYFMRKMLRDDQRWNFAADAVVNWHIENDLKGFNSSGSKDPIELPKDCIRLPDQNLDKESIFSENIYSLIPVNRNQSNSGNNSSNKGSGQKSGQGGKGGKGNGSGNSKDDQLSSAVSDQWEKFERGDTSLVDDHSFMEDFEEVPDELLKQAIGTSIKEATKLAGSSPSGVRQLLEELFDSKVPWRTLLRQFTGNHLKISSRPTWKRPHRRFGSLQQGKTALRSGRIVVVVDTSGSTSQDLPQFFGEVAEIAKTWETWIIQCDAQVHGKPEQWRRGYKVEAKGFGGTDLNPGLEAAMKLKPDCIVVLTDGHLFNQPIDTKRPELWIITQSGQVLQNKNCVKIEPD